MGPGTNGYQQNNQAPAPQGAAVPAGANASNNGGLLQRLTGLTGIDLTKAWNTMTDAGTRAYLKDMAPNAFLDEMSKRFPEMNKVVDVMRQDVQLTTAFRDALAKDETMLPGLRAMASQQGTGFTPDVMAAGLSDAANRRTFTDALRSIADRDDIKFDDFRKFADLAIKANGKEAKTEDYKALRDHLNHMGVQDDRLDFAADPMGGFVAAIRNPIGFANKLPGLMGMSGQQGEAFAQLFRVIAGFIELAIGGEHGYRAWGEKYGPGIVDGAIQMGQDLSGQTDAARAEARTAPATPTPQRVSDAGGITTTVNMRQQYDLAALGISPNVTPEQTAAVAAYDNKQNNDSRSKGPGLTNAFA